MRVFDPQPLARELPARMPSPFEHGMPHPLARRAAEQLQAELRAGLAARLGVDAPGGGKMFAVLVVAARDGRVGYLRAFSGMAAGQWLFEDFVPPVFDAAARDACWPAGERELAGIAAELAEVEAKLAPLAGELAGQQAAHEVELEALRSQHRERRALRKQARVGATPAELHALDQQSRADTAERRRFDADAPAGELAAQVAALTAERTRLVELRAARSRVHLHAIHATYVLANAAGERRTLRELFVPEEPPGGAGDCAAPKLLAAAYARGLQPLALAELWWGTPPATGGRHAGQYYPACRGKCGPILAHMLGGLAVEPPPTFGAREIAADEPRTIFEDRWLIVVAKPEGLLSVPGRGGLTDSVHTRLRARASPADVVHRLDLDTSGVLLAAKDAPTYAALQHAFATRAIDKRYVAIVDGDVRGEHGTITLPLRLDVDDRPRQVVDERYGKVAITEWCVLAREAGRTRVAFYPRTGRAHQLRVHASHAEGLGAPIVGDRLYGRAEGERLLLHAEALAFVHPHTGEAMTFEERAPF